MEKPVWDGRRGVYRVQLANSFHSNDFAIFSILLHLISFDYICVFIIGFVPVLHSVAKCDSRPGNRPSYHHIFWHPCLSINVRMLPVARRSVRHCYFGMEMFSFSSSYPRNSKTWQTSLVISKAAPVRKDRNDSWL